MATLPVSGRDTLRLKPAKAPRLPVAQGVYDPTLHNSQNNLLRLYFNELNNVLDTVVGPEGGRYLSTPYGSFYDTTDQTATVGVASIITLNSTDVAKQVALAEGYKIVATYPGIYNMQFSVQIENSTADDQEVDIWIRQFNRDNVPYYPPDGDLPGSTGAISIVKKHGSANGAALAGWNYFISMQGGDYIQLMWSTTSAGAFFAHRDAQVSPTRPGTSSVVLTMSFVSSLPP